jgi:hypothetical protein
MAFTPRGGRGGGDRGRGGMRGGRGGGDRGGRGGGRGMHLALLERLACSKANTQQVASAAVTEVDVVAEEVAVRPEAVVVTAVAVEADVAALLAQRVVPRSSLYVAINLPV